MSARRRLAWVILLTLAGGACSTAEITVIEATYGANCGAPAGNVTGAVARACDGRSACEFAVDGRRIGDPARGCEKDFDVTWRCATEEAVHSAQARVHEGPPTAVPLQCGSPAPRRIDVLDAAAGHRPVAGLTAAVVERCAGRPACTVSVAGLPPLRTAATSDPDLRVHWRCEGDMTWRETRVARDGDARLTCQ